MSVGKVGINIVVRDSFDGSFWSSSRRIEAGVYLSLGLKIDFYPHQTLHTVFQGPEVLALSSYDHKVHPILAQAHRKNVDH